MIKILFIGGTKYIGRQLIDIFITCPDISLHVASRHKPDFLINCNWRYCDHNNVDDLECLVREATYFDIVIDYACYNYKQAMIACRVFNGKIGHYIFISSQAVYPSGKNHREDRFDPYNQRLEDLMYEFQFYPYHQYSIGKRAAECVFYQHATYAVTAVRFPIVLDSADKRLIKFIENISRNREISCQSRKSEVSLISLNETISFLQQLISILPGYPINASSNGSINMLTVKQILQSQIGLIFLNQISDSHLCQHPYSVHTNWERDPKFCFLDVTESWTISNSYAKSLGFQFKSVNNWFKATIDEILNKGISCEDIHV